MKFLYLMLFLGIACVFMSCSDEEDRVEIKIEGAKNFQEAKEMFEKEHAAWEELYIKNYQFTRTWDSDAFPYYEPITIIVKEDNDPKIVDLQLLPPQLAVYPQNIPGKSISEFFDMVKEELDFIESVENGTYDWYKIKTIYFVIKYDPQYHYPTEFAVSNEYVVPVDGDGVRLKVTEFIPR